MPILYKEVLTWFFSIGMVIFLHSGPQQKSHSKALYRIITPRFSPSPALHTVI